MKTPLLCLALACLSTIVSCRQEGTQVPPAEVGPFTVTSIAQDIYRIEDSNTDNPAGEVFDKRKEKTHFNNCSDIYLLVGKERALLINLSNNVTWENDAAQSLRQTVSDRIGDRPLVITFTHNAPDHMGMLSAFIDDPNVTFELPRIDFESIAGKFPQDRTRFFDEGECIDLGGLRLIARLVPGHTQGSTVYFLEGRDILFSGDALGSGHGLWLFNVEGLQDFAKAIPGLVEYIEDPASGINQDNLVVYGAHYWQRDWLPDSAHLDMQFIRDMQTLTTQMANGTAASTPSDLRHGLMNTQFRLNNALIICNSATAKEFVENH